jgi:hypothetical protein
MLEEMTRPTDLADEAAAEANPWRVALLLAARHGSRAVDVAHDEARRADALERALWQYVAAAAEELLGALSSTDLLYATALAPRPGVAVRRAVGGDRRAAAGAARPQIAYGP